MIKLIKNGYIYQSSAGSSTSTLDAMVGAGNGNGVALFTYERFLGYGVDVWDEWYGPYRSQATAVTLTADGYTAGDLVDLATRRLRTRTLASDGANGFLNLFEATGGGIGGVGGGYQLLSLDGTQVTQGAAAAVTENYTYDGAPAAVLPGTGTFFVHRAGDVNASPGVFTTPRAAFDKVTLVSDTVSYTTIASDLAGYLDLRGVVPIDATTAYAVAGALNMTGDTTENLTSLRFYRLNTDDAVTFSDLTLAAIEGAGPYKGTTANYPVEIFGWNPDSASPHTEQRRWGVTHDGSSFAIEQMPLEQIDLAAQPSGASVTYTTQLTTARYVAVDEQVVVVRAAVNNDSPTVPNNSYLRITQYDGATGEIVDEAWSAGPEPEAGWFRANQGAPTAFYDASLDRLVVGMAETLSQQTSPFHLGVGIRVATFEVSAASYPISEQLRSSGAAFL